MRRPLTEEKLLLAQEFEQGDYTVDEFCALHDIKKHNLYYWRRKLRDQNQAVDDPRFLPIAVDSARGDKQIEIRLPNGIVIQFAELVPIGYLQQLIGQ